MHWILWLGHDLKGRERLANVTYFFFSEKKTTTHTHTHTLWPLNWVLLRCCENTQTSMIFLVRVGNWTETLQHIGKAFDTARAFSGLGLNSLCWARNIVSSKYGMLFAYRDLSIVQKPMTGLVKTKKRSEWPSSLKIDFLPQVDIFDLTSDSTC